MLNTPHSRQTAPCPHFGLCGGCALQHLNDEAYSLHKTQMIRKELDLKGLTSVTVNKPLLIPAGQRRRCNLKAMRLHDVIHLGYHEVKSHSIVQIEQCPLVAPQLETLLAPLRVLLKSLLRNKQKVDLFLLTTDTGIDLILDGITAFTLEQTQKIIRFCEAERVARFSLRHKNGLEPVVTFVEPAIAYDGISVACQADGFTQASKMADDILTQLVLQYMPAPTKRALDLFCGRGTFCLPLSRHARVDGYELDAKALQGLEKAKNKASRPLQLFSRNLFEDPLDEKELKPFDFVVLNPPRAGAQHQCRILSQSTVARIVMVSCDPKTFARDAAILIQGGYELENVTPVDQFLWANHVEVVGCFEKSI